MAEAEADAKQTAAEAEARIAAERNEMLRSARGEVAHLAVLAASEVAGQAAGHRLRPCVGGRVFGKGG